MVGWLLGWQIFLEPFSCSRSVGKIKWNKVLNRNASVLKSAHRSLRHPRNQLTMALSSCTGNSTFPGQYWSLFMSLSWCYFGMKIRILIQSTWLTLSMPLLLKCWADLFISIKLQVVTCNTFLYVCGGRSNFLYHVH